MFQLVERHVEHFTHWLVVSYLGLNGR